MVTNQSKEKRRPGWTTRGGGVVIFEKSNPSGGSILSGIKNENTDGRWAQPPADGRQKREKEGTKT